MQPFSCWFLEQNEREKNDNKFMQQKIEISPISNRHDPKNENGNGTCCHTYAEKNWLSLYTYLAIRSMGLCMHACLLACILLCLMCICSYELYFIFITWSTQRFQSSMPDIFEMRFINITYTAVLLFICWAYKPIPIPRPNSSEYCLKFIENVLDDVEFRDCLPFRTIV